MGVPLGGAGLGRGRGGGGGAAARDSRPSWSIPEPTRIFFFERATEGPPSVRRAFTKQVKGQRQAPGLG